MQNNLLRESRRRLQLAKETLIQEFVGLETVIERVIDAVTPWYLIPEWNLRPVVINLWGMTGTGKSTLVNRLSALLELSERTYRIDLSNSSNREVFTEIKHNRNGERMLLIMDEFQFFRTLDEEKKEKLRVSNYIWELLDSGTFQEADFPWRLVELRMVIKRMRYALERGVRVKNGAVITHITQFVELFEDNEWKDDNEPLWFFPRTAWALLGDLDPEYAIFHVWRNFALTHTAEEQLNELDRIVQTLMQPQTVDCSRSLIFVIGNLDEAYDMSGNMRRDLHADAFHKFSSRIGVQEIKNALRLRFRPEQIARLGNIHILYPTLSAANFREIIQRESNRIAEQLYSVYNTNLIIQPGTIDFIYKEGVYPAQGVRPLISTIRGVLWPAVSQFALYVKKKKEFTWLLDWDATNCNWIFTSEKNIFRHPYTPESNRNLKDVLHEGDKKLIAIHEAGHVHAMLTLMGKFPEYVYNNTFNGSLSGEVHHWPGIQLHTLDSLTNLAAMMLGGWAAEGILFGTENRTFGSDDDLKMATGLIMKALKNTGVDGDPYFMRSELEFQNSNKLFDREGAIDRRAKELLQIAKTRAEESINENKLLFRNLVKAIYESPYLDENAIAEIVKNTGYIMPVSQSEKLSIQRNNAFNTLISSIENTLNTANKNNKAA